MRHTIRVLVVDAGKGKKVTISARLDEGLVDRMDALVRSGAFENRTELLTAALAQYANLLTSDSERMEILVSFDERTRERIEHLILEMNVFDSVAEFLKAAARHYATDVARELNEGDEEFDRLEKGRHPSKRSRLRIQNYEE